MGIASRTKTTTNCLIMNNNIRVRFAPSPTGDLHIGGLRTALFNELFARHNNGKLLLRIEDTDRERSKAVYTDSIIESLKWAGIVFDEIPIVQSERISHHKKIIEILIQEGKAYKCYCTPEEVAQRNRERGNESLYDNKYDRYCLSLDTIFSKSFNINGQAGGNKPFVVRFKLPFEKGPIAFTDLIRGEVTFDVEQLDDFIITRSDGQPMYNFVVVVDDHDMQISHVIRGEDHISNTPKQILLYQACGYAVPQFAHLPLILGPSGNRLSKRDAATSTLEYRQNGYLPQALINYLARLGWAHGDQEKFSKQEMIGLFELKNVGKCGARFDQEKLDWLNGVYMREMSAQALLNLIIADIDPAVEKKTPYFSEQPRYALIDIYKERVKTVAEIVQSIISVHSAPSSFDVDALEEWITPAIRTHLVSIIAILEAVDPFTIELVSQAIKNMAKQLNVKLVMLAQPIRIALLGTSSGPGVFDLVATLGKQETIDRLKKLYSIQIKK